MVRVTRCSIKGRMETQDPTTKFGGMWEKLMIARQRKTLVLCVDCHHQLTKGKLPDRRYFLK